MDGDETGEDGTAQGLAAPLDGAHQDGQQIEMEGGFHKVTQNDNHEIDDQGDDQCAHGAGFFRQFAEQEGAGDPDELGNQESGNEVGLADPDLHTVDGGHFDDGVDSVGKKPKGDQKLEQFRVALKTADGFEGGANAGSGEGEGLFFHARVCCAIVDMTEKGNGEEKPPDPHR